VRLLEVDAELEVAEHYFLNQLLAVGVVPLLALDDIVEGVQGSARLADLDKFISFGDGILRALEVARPHLGDSLHSCPKPIVNSLKKCYQA